MIKNINLEFYQFILLIIMIFITVYVWIKSIIKCSNKNTFNYEKIYNENKKLKKYIYIHNNLNSGNYNNNLNSVKYNNNLNSVKYNTDKYNTSNLNSDKYNTSLNSDKYNTSNLNTDKYNTSNLNTDNLNSGNLNTDNYNYNDKIIY
jgi:hypothetical protein